MTVLTIAGSDSIGGAGVQADVKTCCALGVYAMTAVTAITAQNTAGVMAWEAVSTEMVRKQLKAVIEDVRPDAVKIGMLPTVETVDAVAEAIDHYGLERVVLDPVCVATSGDALTGESVPERIARELFGRVTLVTPNVPEAELFADMKIGEDDPDEAARRIMERYGARAVLMKGGHFGGRMSTDRLYEAGRGLTLTVENERTETQNTHGTGCTYSSAIAAFLAKGCALDDAVERAKCVIDRFIREGKDYETGRGHGPVNHIYQTIQN